MAFKTFLCCFKAETGGIVIGFFGFVSNLLSLFSFTIYIIYMNAVGMGCHDIKQFLVRSPLASFANLCYVFVPGIFLYLLFCAVVCFLCVKGVENRDHVRVRPLMIYYGVITAISFLGIIFLFWIGESGFVFVITFIIALVQTLFIGYIFSVLYSLYDIFHKEFLNGLTTHYHNIPMTIDPSSPSAPEKLRAENDFNSPC